MRNITKDITLTIDGSPQGFRLTKPDAFSGVEILRLLLRLQDRWEAVRRDGSILLPCGRLIFFLPELEPVSVEVEDVIEIEVVVIVVIMMDQNIFGGIYKRLYMKLMMNFRLKDI